MKKYLGILLAMMTVLWLPEIKAGNNWNDVEKAMAEGDALSLSFSGMDLDGYGYDYTVDFSKPDSDLLKIETSFNKGILNCNGVGVKHSNDFKVYLFLDAPHTDPSLQLFIPDYNKDYPGIIYESGGKSVMMSVENVTVKDGNSNVIYLWSYDTINQKSPGNDRLLSLTEYMIRGLKVKRY